MQIVITDGYELNPGDLDWESVSNLGDIKWVATEDGSPGKGTGRHIAQFVLEPKTI